MLDDLGKIAADPRFIVLEREHEIRGWTQTFGCTEKELRDAIKAVGPSAEAVRRFLAKIY